MVLPFPKGLPRPTAPGTTLMAEPPQSCVEQLRKTFPFGTAAWCPSWHLCGSASQGYCKVLVLVQFDFFTTQDCPRLELTKKQVLKVMDQTVHRQTVYPIYKSEILVRKEKLAVVQIAAPTSP